MSDVVNKIQKMIDILDEYHGSVESYRKKVEDLKKQNIQDLITSTKMNVGIDEESKKIAESAERYKEKFKAAQSEAVESIRNDINNPRFASDTGFLNVLETIKKSNGAFDMDSGVVVGMVKPYLGDYAARLLIAKTIDDYTSLKSGLLGISTENPLLVAQSMDELVSIEFGEGKYFLENETRLKQNLEYLLSIVKGESIEKPITSFMF